jgi:hypothetical protein
MKPKILQRIAAIVILVHLLGHTVGHIMWDNPEDPKMKEVVNAMKSHESDFMGASKSMADYYEGYSWEIFFLYGMTISILWFVSGFKTDEKTIAKKVLYPIAVAYMAFGIIEFIHFFPFAASLSIVAGILIAISLMIGSEKYTG